MKYYCSLNVLRTVRQLIMRVHKPKVEYKLALQEKPQGSILAYYYKTNNLTRINWLNTRLIIASNKIRHEIPFKTKRVKYTVIWKKSIKIVKESKLSFFFYIAHNVLLTPLPFQFYFPPQFFLFSSPQFYYFPSSMFLFPPSQFLLFSLLNVSYSPPPPPPPPPHFYCFLLTTTTATFLLFFLHHHPHHHISIVFSTPPPPPPHFYCFPSTSTTTTTFLLFSLHHHVHHRYRHISIVFPRPPPLPPYFYCFLLLVVLLHLLLISIVFPQKSKEAKIRPKRPKRPSLEGPLSDH